MNSKLSLLCTLCFLPLLSLYAQQAPIEYLQGKTIVIPGRNPSEVLYTPMAIEKESFKEKYRYHGNIIDKPLFVYRVSLTEGNNHKAGCILEMKNGADTVVMHLPLRFPSKLYKSSKYSVFKDREYYSQTTEALTLVRDLREILSIHLRLPHYDYNDLQQVKKNFVGKTSYNIRNGHKIFVHSIDKDEMGFYNLNYEDNGSPKVRSIFHNIDDARMFTNQSEFTLRKFIEDHVLEDSLKIHAQKKPEYPYFFQLKEKYMNKRLYIKHISLEYQNREIHNLTDETRYNSQSAGYYIFKDVRLLGFRCGRKLPKFETYVILQETEGEKDEIAIPYTIKEFETEVTPAEEQEEIVRQRKIKEAKRERERIEREKKEEAEAHAQLVRRFGSRNAKDIEEGVIRLGFTKAMVEEAWGYPSDETSITNQLGRVDCWTYGYSSFVYFSNGKVVQIIN